MVWLWRTFAVVSLLFILDRIVSTVGPDAEPPFANTRGVDVGAFYTVATMLRQGQRHELGRVDAHQNPALTARGDGHVPVDQEREAAEHLLLGHARLVGDEAANARGERFVVRHRPRY